MQYYWWRIEETVSRTPDNEMEITAKTDSKIPVFLDRRICELHQSGHIESHPDCP